jgi:hypothetical protein
MLSLLDAIQFFNFHPIGLAKYVGSIIKMRLKILHPAFRSGGTSTFHTNWAAVNASQGANLAATGAKGLSLHNRFLNAKKVISNV